MTTPHREAGQERDEAYMNGIVIIPALETYTPEEIKAAMMELGYRLFYTDFDDRLLPKLREMRKRIYETAIFSSNSTEAA